MFLFVYWTSADNRTTKRQLKRTMTLTDFTYKKNDIPDRVNYRAGMATFCAAFLKMVTSTTP